MQDLMHNWIDENQHRIFKAYFDDLIVNSIKRERKSLTSMVFGSIKIDQKEKNAVLIASITIRNKHLKSAISMRSTRFVLLCSRLRRQIALMFFCPTFTFSRRKTLVISFGYTFYTWQQNQTWWRFLEGFIFSFVVCRLSFRIPSLDEIKWIAILLKYFHDMFPFLAFPCCRGWNLVIPIQKCINIRLFMCRRVRIIVQIFVRMGGFPICGYM